ncbi:type I-E CRISPR-associated protein Cse2/CasB, partial [Nocardia sp. NPDC049707]|uniref:type I-E CRISPR-associated protein Cse2/CasB n=1 Tax=Nocardia sp. NPDC049707 TaxID=3154735 RepID=UPI00341B7BDB
TALALVTSSYFDGMVYPSSSRKKVSTKPGVIQRADSGTPPNWYQLAVDLLRWTDPDRKVQHHWARDFYLPHTNSRRVR